MISKENRFTAFQSSIDDYDLPERFTFPFHYDPHPLCILAAEELQAHIQSQTDWKHDFGMEATEADSIYGKMFGVLLVRNQDEQIGYLSAFSGKLADQNFLPKFVPPVFDTFAEGNPILLGMEKVSQLNEQIFQLENQKDYIASLEILQKEKAKADQELSDEKLKIKTAKQKRKALRQEAKEKLPPNEYEQLINKLGGESLQMKNEFKRISRNIKNRILEYQQTVDVFERKIIPLKEKRKQQSADLQNQLFEKYQFLNPKGVSKNLHEIFHPHTPIGGAGECAAPKLLQYAFLHQMQPLAMAEFWWGSSPKTEIRNHQNFYPACLGKCKPILTHMLDGISVDENPLLKNPAIGKDISITFEDEHLLVINKPAEFLSVPGRHIKDSVVERIKQKYPEATGPLIVHRLDMSTSGLILIAKTQEVHKFLQKQFIRRTIKKRYVALLDGILEKEEGVIDLPLMTDWNHRPRQMVSFEKGKSAQTRFHVISHHQQKTRILLYPITGRTHQLRVHAAHPLGLNLPILGDDLYGKKSDRLYLHAEWIEFEHPATRKRMSVESKAKF